VRLAQVRHDLGKYPLLRAGQAKLEARNEFVNGSVPFLKGNSRLLPGKVSKGAQA
jgi:hypothetical protein